MKPGDTKYADKGVKSKWCWAWKEVVKNMELSVHSNIFFPNWISTQKILWIDSGKQQPPTTRCHMPDNSRSLPPAAGSALLEGRRVMLCGNTVGVAETGSRCLMHRSFEDCKLPGQPVSPWPLQHAPAGSTLLWGERGVQCQHFTPSCLAGGRRYRGHVYVYVRQKCTIQSQKQWHFLSLNMVALFYN